MGAPNYRLNDLPQGNAEGANVSLASILDVTLLKQGSDSISERTFWSKPDCTRDCSCDSDCKNHCYCDSACRRLSCGTDSCRRDEDSECA